MCTYTHSYHTIPYHPITCTSLSGFYFVSFLSNNALGVRCARFALTIMVLFASIPWRLCYNVLRLDPQQFCHSQADLYIESKFQIVDLSIKSKIFAGIFGFAYFWIFNLVSIAWTNICFFNAMDDNWLYRWCDSINLRVHRRIFPQMMTFSN